MRCEILTWLRYVLIVLFAPPHPTPTSSPASCPAHDPGAQICGSALTGGFPGAWLWEALGHGQRAGGLFAVFSNHVPWSRLWQTVSIKCQVVNILSFNLYGPRDKIKAMI